jgi:dihydroxycyclohexadiene carboxylate dehydrogenase
MRQLENKFAIVTGAAQGVGRAIAVRMASEGAAVALVDKTEALCDAAAAELAVHGTQVIRIAANLETHAGAQAMMSQVLAQFGRLDIAVNNVGGAIKAKPFWEYSGAEIEAEISRSLWPTLWCCREEIPAMLEQGAGSIINIGSAATRWLWRVPYSAAKGGVHAMTSCLAQELAQTGVRVNCISPGALEITNRVSARNTEPLSEQEAQWRQKALDQSVDDTPMGRPGLADEIAGSVCYFASDDASYITGQTLFVAGGAVG